MRDTEERGPSFLAEMVANAHLSPTGKFKGFIIEGELRIGKTSYSIQAMRDVFMLLDPALSIDEAYELALRHIHFKIGPFLKLILEKQREIRTALPKIDWSKRIPVLTLDDASLYAGVDLFFKDQKLYAAFQDTMTTIGTAISSLIITAPAVDALAKPLREYYDYHPVRITEFDRYRREATIKEWYTARSGRLNTKKMHKDRFNVLIPDKYYSRYLAERIALGEAAVEELMAAVKQGTISKDVAIKVLKGLPDFKELRREIAEVVEGESPFPIP
jgi:hypothetical protein